MQLLTVNSLFVCKNASKICIHYSNNSSYAIIDNNGMMQYFRIQAVKLAGW